MTCFFICLAFLLPILKSIFLLKDTFLYIVINKNIMKSISWTQSVPSNLFGSHDFQINFKDTINSWKKNNFQVSFQIWTGNCKFVCKYIFITFCIHAQKPYIFFQKWICEKVKIRNSHSLFRLAVLNFFLSSQYLSMSIKDNIFFHFQLRNDILKQAELFSCWWSLCK